MRIRQAHRALFLANRPAFMTALAPVLDANYGLEPTPPTGQLERAIFDTLMDDLRRDRELTAVKRNAAGRGITSAIHAQR